MGNSTDFPLPLSSTALVPFPPFFFPFLPHLLYLYLSSQIGESLDTPKVPFLENFSWAFAQMDPVNVSAEFEVRDFTRS